ncbi:MAG: hypothetical protein EFT35_09400 [Methanophagales archaeon ANME-1-THS]|nr:MAG: hypothetical protein EFT35_09400 [Methanophagales archaeon ANME-1-THS]
MKKSEGGEGEVAGRDMKRCTMPGELEEKSAQNLILQALPYTFLISSLVIIGLFSGLIIGRRIGGDIAGFLFALSLSLLGFFAGLLITYTIVKLKYPIKN